MTRAGAAVVWLTGRPGAGKSTLAALLRERLGARDIASAVLDGDAVRQGLSRDLGFSAADRAENVRRVGEVARLMADAGLVVIVALISPHRDARRAVRDRFAAGEFFEVFVDTPLEVAQERDSKGLYARARRGELTDFTGLDAPYEAPDAPDLRIDTTTTDADAAADVVLDLLRL